MKTLEAQEELAESVEQTFRNSPERQPKPVEEQPKSLLESKDSYQEQVLTETQEELQGKDITQILDIDSNVINYGQFICGKILGSTLLLSNISDED